MEIGKAEKKIKLFFTLLACILNSSFFRLIFIIIHNLEANYKATITYLGLEKIVYSYTTNNL